MNGWEQVKLGDLYSVHNGISKGKQFFGKGYPFLSFSTVFNNWFLPLKLDSLVESTEQEQNSYSIRRGDVFITRTSETMDELGMSSVALNDIPNATYNGFTKRLRPITNKVLPEFIGYYMRSPKFRGKFMAFSSMTTRASLSNAELLGMQIELPCLEMQYNIATILRSYDNLIDNYRRQIKLLEEAAQRLYKEWFVDLRFPGYEHTKIVDGVPEGWKYGYITDISECFDNKRKPLSSTERDRQQKKFPYYGAASLMDYVEHYIYDGIYLLFGEDGTVITTDGTPVLQYVWGKFWVNNHAHVFQGIAPYSTEFLYMLCKHMKVTDIVTGVAQPKISRGRLNKKNILIPTEKLVHKYSVLVESWFCKLRTLKKENDLLIEARDRLLPKLMSGEIKV